MVRLDIKRGGSSVLSSNLASNPLTHSAPQIRYSNPKARAGYHGFAARGANKNANTNGNGNANARGSPVESPQERHKIKHINPAAAIRHGHHHHYHHQQVHAQQQQQHQQQQQVVVVDGRHQDLNLNKHNNDNSLEEHRSHVQQREHYSRNPGWQSKENLNGAQITPQKVMLYDNGEYNTDQMNNFAIGNINNNNNNSDNVVHVSNNFDNSDSNSRQRYQRSGNSISMQNTGNPGKHDAYSSGTSSDIMNPITENIDMCDITDGDMIVNNLKINGYESHRMGLDAHNMNENMNFHYVHGGDNNNKDRLDLNGNQISRKTEYDHLNNQNVSYLSTMENQRNGNLMNNWDWEEKHKNM